MQNYTYIHTHAQDFIEDFVFTAAHSEIVRYSKGEPVTCAAARSSPEQVAAACLYLMYACMIHGCLSRMAAAFLYLMYACMIHGCLSRMAAACLHLMYACMIHGCLSRV